MPFPTKQWQGRLQKYMSNKGRIHATVWKMLWNIRAHMETILSPVPAQPSILKHILEHGQAYTAYTKNYRVQKVRAFSVAVPKAVRVTT
jgi:hypothetical protein